MLKYFLILDSFGINVSFYLRGYKNYRSHFGGFVTIIIYIVTIICGFIFFANQIYERKSPKVSTTSGIFKNPTKISYPDNLFFMLGLTVNSTPFINESIYRPIGQIKTKKNGTELFTVKNI
jgi:hypothetical protein